MAGAAGPTTAALLLYLNPELPAYSNVRTVEAAAAWLAAGGGGATEMPAVPTGFDPRVFAAVQPDVSAANRRVRDAMLAEGIPWGAVARRGAHVATLLSPARLTGASRLTADVPLTPGTLQAGDDLRVRRAHGDSLHATVAAVDYDAGAVTLCNASRPLSLSSGSRDGFLLFGIRLYDAERQALAGYASGAADTTEPDDVVPRPDFEASMYRAVYPDTRGYAPWDVYLDYRQRWKRDEEYRLTRGKDVFNLEAPYTSNALGQTGGGAGGSVSSYFTTGPSNAAMARGRDAFFSPGYVELAASNVVVTPSRVTMGGGSNLVVGRGDVSIAGPALQVSWATGGLTAGDGNMAVTPDSATIGSGLCVGGTVGVGMLPPPAPASGGSGGAAMAVAGDILTTGTLITLSDRRAKRELRPIEDALRKVGELRGYTYDTLADDRRRHTGLVAQDVERVLPEAVYDTPDGRKSVAYGNLAGLMVEAINALAARLPPPPPHECPVPNSG